ncbi:MAG: glycosyltransferase, partial [Hyphomicrobiales bacterium]
EGFQKLLAAKGPCFELIISGDGPEQKIIDTYCNNNPELKKTIRYERVFNRWQDRLNPFLESDVFIYPTQHAGWGIVVPEAMAAGLAVISSDKAEASRYLIDHERNGMIVNEEIDDFTNCLMRCIDNPAWVSNLGIEARKSALRCHAPYVAEQLTNTLRIATNGKI